ncbi:MAG: dihydrodipicolinate synthase family protein [Opitutales bacterium]|nr:dihydrodipicolinate synthase family protein [Opitutales bacterium]MBT5814488.1 dihydrodipicolinate synthase family protein [Opitutales bacterium]
MSIEEKTALLTPKALRGSALVPMITPFDEKGDLDEKAVVRLVDHILDGGCQGIVACGTTGEAVSMSRKMRIRLAEICVKSMKGRGVLLFGIGDDILERSVEIGKAAIEAGVDALIAHLPSYYSITEPQMEKWFVDLADRINAPIFLYNIPQTTGLSLSLAAVKRLSHHPLIVGIKDSDANERRQIKLGRMFSKRKDFAYLCGAGELVNSAMLNGAVGFTPSLGNLLPELVSKLMKCHSNGDEAGYVSISNSLNELAKVLQGGRGISRGLSSLKAAVSRTRLCKPHMLLPLAGLTSSERTELGKSIKILGVGES